MPEEMNGILLSVIFIGNIVGIILVKSQLINIWEGRPCDEYYSLRISSPFFQFSDYDGNLRERDIWYRGVTIIRNTLEHFLYYKQFIYDRNHGVSRK